MNLATRCPACGTVFRVVPDQLKVSDGWVRCGRCTEVFNAGQRLFDLEQESPPALTPSDPVPGRSAEVLPLHGGNRQDDTALPLETTDPADAEAPTPALPPEPPEPPGEPPPAPPAEAAADHAVAPQPVTAPTPPAAAPPSVAADEPVPGFLRRAEQAERWRQPGRRGLLAGIAVLLALLLAGQMALHYRDRLAAASPTARPLLLAACSLLGCKVEPPRRIEALNVDSSGLLRVQGSPLYRLSLVVQNKAPTEVRMPAVDLVLTDAQGQTLARRVLTAAELGQSAEQLTAGGEATLQATLDLGERRVAGYTVELFYP